MEDLYVDVDALRELSRQLGEVKTALQRANQGIDRSGAALGSERLAGAVDDFVDGWRDARGHLVKEVDALLGRIRTAIETYREQEAQLSKAAGGEA
ncbi:MAG TPA: hypothetical protein VF045_02175 [Acidimicrobiales bacterium]